MREAFYLLKCLCVIFCSTTQLIGQGHKGTNKLAVDLKEKIEQADKILRYQYTGDSYTVSFHELNLDKSNYYQKMSMSTSSGRKMYGNLTDLFEFFTQRKYEANPSINSKYYELEISLLKENYMLSSKDQNRIIEDILEKLKLHIEIEEFEVEALCIYLTNPEDLRKHKSGKFKGSVFKENERTVKFESYKIKRITEKLENVIDLRIQFKEIPDLEGYFDLKLRIDDMDNFLQGLQTYGFSHEKCKTTVSKHNIVRE